MNESQEMYEKVISVLEDKTTVDEDGILKITVYQKFSDLLIENDNFELAQGVLEKLMAILENKKEDLEYEELWLETKEKLDFTIEINTTE